MHANEIAAKHCTPRYHRLDRFEKYVIGTQYDGRPPFLAESDDAPPLLERAPCIVYPLVANAIRSHADFCLGEGRWPAIRPRAGQMGEEDSEAFAARLLAILDEADVESAAREAFEAGLASGTAASIVGRRDGSLFVENTRAAWCTPKFKRGGVVESLEIRYPYTDTFFNGSTGDYEDRCMLYRRVIDATRDVTYLPMPAPEDGRAPVGWVEDPARTVVHGMAFCPVVWWPAMAKCEKAGEIDGHPVHEHLLDEIDALNFALSQRHRAALYAGDPMRWESGVDSSSPAGQTGRDASVFVEQDGRHGGPHPKGTFRFAGGSTGTVRKVGAGAVWSSENPDYKVGLLTLPGDALKVIDDHARDLKSKLHESMGVVDIDIENAKLAADMSGKAQQVARQRQVDRDNAYRQDFGARWLVPVVKMLLKVARVQPDAAIDALRLDLAWGPYFASTAADQKAIVELCAAALDAKIITRRIAIEKLRTEGVFPIDSAASVASEPTVEDALTVAGLSLGSETFDRIYKLRLAMALLGEVDPAMAKQIEGELEATADHSTALREAMTDGDENEDDAETLGPSSEDDDEEPASDRGGESEADPAGD